MSTDGGTTRSQLLRTNAYMFSKAFLFGTMPVDDLLTTYFQERPTITQHGAKWVTEHLPFLGFTFKGRTRNQGSRGDESCDAYFAKLRATLALHADEHSLPAQGDPVVDPNANGKSGVVFVKAKAKMTALATQMS